LKLTPAYVALGANLGRPEDQVRAGFEELAMLPQTRLARVSSLYRTAPVGFEAQPDFINAVAKIETALGPRALLDALIAIERRHGRVRDVPNGPRTLDLDIALYDEIELQEPGLTIPHPRMHERAFVMAPLAEIAPDAIVPGRGRAGDLAAALDSRNIVKLAADA
jgi:2-amino-4-hydroxy-6-hydroxymethyldihydropteridine diphosphokinase